MRVLQQTRRRVRERKQHDRRQTAKNEEAIMIRIGKKAAVLTAAGLFAAASVTGCSGSIDTEAVVATVGDEEITLGVANFYARLTQGQYETYYAGMMGTTAEAMCTQEAEEDKTYEDSTKETLMEALENLYLMSQHAEEYEVSLSEDEQKAIEEAVKQFDEDNTDQAKEIVSGYRKDVQKYLELMTISQKMTEKMREGVDENVSDEEAAQKAMQYVFFSYQTTDEEGNSIELTDEEKESLKETAQAFCDAVRAGTDAETAAADAGVEVQTATFDAESTTPDTALVVVPSNFVLEDAAGKFVAFDISLENNGTKIQPNGKVQISIPIPEGYDRERLTVYHIADDRMKIELPCTVIGDDLTFETDHFSLHVLAETAANETAADASQTDKALTPQEDKESSPVPWIILGVVIVLIAGAAAAVLFLKKRNNG